MDDDGVTIEPESDSDNDVRVGEDFVRGLPAEGICVVGEAGGGECSRATNEGTLRELLSRDEGGTREVGEVGEGTTALDGKEDEAERCGSSALGVFVPGLHDGVLEVRRLGGKGGRGVE